MNGNVEARIRALVLEKVAEWRKRRDSMWSYNRSAVGYPETERYHRACQMDSDATELHKLLAALLAAVREGAPAWTCGAKPSTDPPPDCNWPVCGCDPYADKVIAALQECDLLKAADDGGRSPEALVRWEPALNGSAFIGMLTHPEGNWYARVDVERLRAGGRSPEEEHEADNRAGSGLDCRGPMVSGAPPAPSQTGIPESGAVAAEPAEPKPWCQICGAELGGLYCETCRAILAGVGGAVPAPTENKMAHPTRELCYVQAATMERCDRAAGHKGPHTWEFWRALDESVKLQSHYAELLNEQDGGQRLTFADVGAWIVRLWDTGTIRGFLGRGPTEEPPMSRSRGAINDLFRITKCRACGGQICPIENGCRNDRCPSNQPKPKKPKRAKR